MPSVPDPEHVKPWYLRNITEALALDEASGNVFIRTGIEGDIIITGNVNIPGTITVNSSAEDPVHVHLDEVGTSGILTVPWMPVSIDGNSAVTITSGNVRVTQGTDPWVVSGNVNANVSGNVVVTEGNITFTNTSIEVTQGTDPWNITGNVIANLDANASVTVSNQNPAYLSVFEEPLAVTITPVIQQNAVYGLDPAEWVTTELNNGTVSVNTNSVWQVQSGTTAGGYARLATSKYMTYLPGQGSMFRWTAAFTANGTTKNAFGVDNIVQNTGPIDREDGYSVGYSGSTANDASRKIGFLHRRNGSAQIQKLTVTVAPTGSQTATITLNSVPFTVALTTSTSTAYTAKQIALALIANPVAGQLWDIEACSNIVTFTYYSPGPKTGTYSFSSAGAGTIAVAAFSQFVLGVTPIDVWTYVGSWDNQSITFDPTKLNVFGLDMRWLGAGIVRLFMEDPTTGKMVLLHTQKWSSTELVPHMNKPSLRLVYRSGTTNNAITPSQNVIVSGASVFAGIQGIIAQTTASQSYYALDGTTRAKDTVWHLLSIQNPLTRGQDINKSYLILQDLSVSAQANDPSVVYLVKNCVGSSSLILFQPIPNASAFNFAQYSTTAVTEDLTLDNVGLVQSLGVNGSAQFVLAPYNLTLSPGETVSFFISSTNAINKTSIGLAWKID